LIELLKEFEIKKTGNDRKSENSNKNSLFIPVFQLSVLPVLSFKKKKYIIKKNIPEKVDFEIKFLKFLIEYK
tara:strand:+ start:204 stop:419 length:216 start_codon:yes stop_codon:yes gene_type:complete